MNRLTRKIFNIKCKNPIIKQTQKVLFSTNINTTRKCLTVPTYLMIGIGCAYYVYASLILSGHNSDNINVDDIIYSIPFWPLYIPLMTILNCCFIYEKYIVK